jgi:lipid-binding SYLF domain-containing protein
MARRVTRILTWIMGVQKSPSHVPLRLIACRRLFCRLRRFHATIVLPRLAVGEPRQDDRPGDRNMKTTSRSLTQVLLAALLAWPLASAQAVEEGKGQAAQLSRDSHAALKKLYARVPFAKALGPKAYAILVFPEVVKAGLIVGGQYGEGALIKGGKTVGYYNTGGASYGLQAGAQRYGYALFFMNRKALGQIDKSDGFEVGVGPSVVVVDQGMAKQATTTTAQDDIYAFVFAQEGLMAGIGIQGNKITRINPK